MNPRLTEAVRGEGAEELLHLLRATYLEQESHGFAAFPAATPALTQAKRLDLVDSDDPHHVKLTAPGYRIASFAKEYSNWIDSRRAIPEGVTPELVDGKRLLDVGCSFGRHLATFGRLGATAVGIELEFPFLELSHLFTAREGLPPLRLAQANATRLPFPARSFDVVFCRLVLNYVPVRETLGEFARVLVPGGLLILAFGTFREGLDFVRRARWRGNLRTVAWRGFGLLNTLLLQATGRQASIRAKGRMYGRHTPTWPSPSWMASELRRVGFVEPPGGFQVHRMPVVFHAVRTNTPPAPTPSATAPA